MLFRSVVEAIKKRYAPVEDEPVSEPVVLIKRDLNENMIYLRGEFGGSFDLMIKEMDFAGNRAAFVMCEGMFDKKLLAESIVKPILKAAHMPRKPMDQLEYIRGEVACNVDAKDIYNFGDAENLLMSGFALLFIDGVNSCQAYGVQGFETRSISEPETQAQERGSREGFVEALKINTTMIRRRLKTASARFDMMNIGATSNTQVCLCYLADRVQPDILQEVKARLAKATLDTVMESGYLQPFLDSKMPSLFSAVGVEERPDTFCAKLTEGRVGVLVDGTPFALVVPYLFIEHFHSLDDYTLRPFYAVFIRVLKLLSFFISVLLPGFYVAVATFHQELFPETILYDIVSTHARTPLPIMIEAFVIHLIYEIMREAGLRIPKQIGQAVSIIGAIVIGDAAVTAGIIAPPMLIIVALSAVTSFVTPSLFQPVALLRFVFILIGGTLGFYGIMMALGLLLVNMCAISPYGIPFMAPVAPFERSALRDTVYRSGWQSLGKRKMKIQNLNGSERKDVKGR